MKFVKINPGYFFRGDTLVSITEPFFLCSTQVKQRQWKAVMGNNPSRFKGNDDLPVENVSWNDVQDFIKKLNQREGRDVFRLPTEAEWEYACFGDDESQLSDYAWYEDNSGEKTHPVGTRKPNAWGLYDMHGNVWEWCEDWYGEYTPGRVIRSSLVKKAADFLKRVLCGGRRPNTVKVVTDPSGPSEGSYRVLRGGSWRSVAQYCRCAFRYTCSPGSCGDSHGFRLVKTFGKHNT